MSEERIAVEAPRSGETPEWELFVREQSQEPLRHAGSLTAPSADVAREQAERLFGWGVAAFWLCPADETRRFVAPESTLDAGDSAEESRDLEGGAEP